MGQPDILNKLCARNATRGGPHGVACRTWGGRGGTGSTEQICPSELGWVGQLHFSPSYTEHNSAIQHKKFYDARKKLAWPEAVQISSSVDEYVLCSRHWIDERLQQAKELLERIDNVQNDADYNLAQKDTETEEKLRQLEAQSERAMGEQKVGGYASTKNFLSEEKWELRRAVLCGRVVLLYGRDNYAPLQDCYYGEWSS